MARILKFKRITFNNPFKGWRRAFDKDARDLPMREARFTRVRARSIMRKAPQRPRTVYGQIKAYSKRSKKYGKYYWQKGLYSRPGHPPFHHGQTFNLRTIAYREIRATNMPTKPLKPGGRLINYRVGPIYKERPWEPSKPVPMLHEWGGTVSLQPRDGQTYKTRNPKIRLRRKEAGKAVYKRRPYMEPAAEEARWSAMKKSPQSMKKLYKLGVRSNQRIKIVGERIAA